MDSDKVKWTDIAIVVLTLGIVSVSAMQWHEMHSGSSDTHDLAIAAKAQADAAKALGDSTKTIAESAKSQAANTQSLAESTSDEVHRLEESVQEARRLAAASEAANKNAKDAERPWIGAYMVVQDFEVGKSPVLTMTMVNTGRRPARITLAEVRATDYQSFPTKPVYEVATDLQSVVLMVPGQVATSVLSVEPLSEQHFGVLANGQYRYYVHANIEYVDVLTQVSHWTHVCWQYFPKIKVGAGSFANCREYNEAN